MIAPFENGELPNHTVGARPRHESRPTSASAAMPSPEVTRHEPPIAKTCSARVPGAGFEPALRSRERGV